MAGKILYIANSSLASPTGGGRTRIISAAKQTQKHGFTVKTLCFVPSSQLSLVIKSLFSGKLTLSKEMEGAVYYIPRLPFTQFKWIAGLNKWYCGIWTALICWLNSIRAAHCHGVKPSLYALDAKRFNKKIKVVADIHGASVDEYMYEKGITEPDEFAGKLEAEEARVFSEADWLIFVSDAMRRFYENKFGRKYSRSTIIPCATETTGKNLNGLGKTLKQKYNLEDKLIFCYVGSGESYQLPGQMCQIFKKIREIFPNAFLLIFSHHKDVFLKQLAEAGISQEHYKIDAVKQSEVFNVLQMGDIGFLLRDDSIVNRVSSPTKFGEYCLSGMPVITTEWVGDISKIVEENQLGLIVDLESPVLNPKLIEFIKNVQQNRPGFSERCSAFVKEEFSWNAFGSKLKSIYSSVNQR